MPYVLPTFNLTCNVWHNPSAASVYLLPDATFGCNLSIGKRVFSGYALGVVHVGAILLLPALTDIRAAWNGLNPDLVECPAGSQRLYFAESVDDFGKGFSNEHRFAVLLQQLAGFTFSTGLIPFPVPLP